MCKWLSVSSCESWISPNNVWYPILHELGVEATVYWCVIVTCLSYPFIVSLLCLLNGYQERQNFLPCHHYILFEFINCIFRTLAMQGDRNFPKIWRFSFARLPWWCLTVALLCESSWQVLVSETTKSLVKNSIHSTNSVKSSYLNR